MASDVNENTIANQDQQQTIAETTDDVDLSSSQENLISSENTPSISQSNDNEELSTTSESNILSASSSDDVVKSSSTTNSKTTTKSSLSISAPKVTNVYKKNGVFKVTVKDKNTKKPVKGIKLNIKVYTGKKYKTFSQKTDKNGIVKINTKSFAKGTHEVVVTAKATKKYYAKTVKSSIKIKKAESKKSNGKLSTTIQCKGSVERQSYSRTSTLYVNLQPMYQTFTYYYPVVRITPILKGSDGKNIQGKYHATLKYESGRSETFEGSFGQYKEYRGSDGLGHYQLIITYDGNSKYSSATWKSGSSDNIYFSK